MPSDLSYWIISSPLKDGDPGIMLSDVRNALGDSVEVGQWEVPELKVCPVDLHHRLGERASKGQFCYKNRERNAGERNADNVDRYPLTAPQLIRYAPQTRFPIHSNSVKDPRHASFAHG